MELSSRLVERFPPSLTAVFDFACGLVDDAAMKVIAEADYGYGYAEVLPLLRSMRLTGQISQPVYYQLAEVLQLTRWADPEKPNQPPFRRGPVGESGHRTRFFACAALLVMHGRTPDECEDIGHCETIAQAIRNAKVIGVDADVALVRHFLFAISENNGWLVDREVFLGMLCLIVRMIDTVPLTIVDDVADIALEVDSMRAEREMKRRLAGLTPEPQPKFSGHELRFWGAIKSEYFNRVAQRPPSETREKLELCKMLLR